jgi:transposase
MPIILLFAILVSVITTEKTYDTLTQAELLSALTESQLTIEKLRHELDQFKRLVFGSRHERFIPAQSKEQLSLELNATVVDESSVVSTQAISYTRTRTEPAKQGTPVRMKLPASLPREQVIIEPSEDVSGMKEIGKEVTEELEYTPGKFFVREYIRPKYARAQHEEGKPGVVIGNLPVRIIEKGIAGPGLLAQIIIDKYVDHLPLYRQIERFKRSGINLPISTVSDWVSRAVDELVPLHEVHKASVLRSHYLEGDETTIKVLDKGKKGKTHLGYYWVYRAPLENLVLFDYRPGRSREGPSDLLKDYKGYLQTDGYEVYDSFGKIQGITLVGCMAHARRKFFDSIGNDKQRSEYALERIQELYAVEDEAVEKGLTHEQRYTLRQEKSVPLLKELEQWMRIEYASINASQVGKAMAYCLRRWEKLCLYTTDGKLQIDNNLVENAIRIVAIGRKNYLFAGSHQAAQRAAIIYSLLGTCKINNINPYEWLKDVFETIPTHPHKLIQELLPHRWKKYPSEA